MVTRQKKGIVLFIAALAALVAAGLWYATSVGRPAQELSAAAGSVLPEVGNPAPAFRLTDLSGKKVQLSDFKGKPVFLNYWATWCSFCRAEFPEIEQAYRDYGTTGKVVFLAVDVGEAASVVRQYVNRTGSRVPVALDPNGQTAERYLVQGLPTSYFIGRDGRIRDRVVGALDGPGLRTRLEALLQ